MRRLIFCCLVLFLVQILIGGCAGPKKPPVIIGEERIVERSREFRPDWIATPVSIGEEMFSFSGGVDGVADFSLALRRARGEVIKNIIAGIENRVGAEFSDAVRELSISDAELSEFSTETVGVIMEIYQMHGIKPKETYYEKVERPTAEGVEYLYNCYQLVDLSRTEYMEWRDSAVERIRDRAKAENKKRLEEIATQILKKLSE
ncbi:hypothetical protein GTN66_00560 [bacterium]|nr:hypothetical protein [bacterium]NIN91517.1 hypothetical protein [bacterium]NIO17922.1 hypothetical protein [bacterium]NIO72903.1 hypothetical protein [bacterium]